VTLLAVKPVWANAILQGRKKWEYRRLPPRLDYGSRVFLYATLKVGALVGEFTAGRVVTESADKLLDLTCHDTPHWREVIREYLSGLTTATAIEITNPVSYRVPLTLRRLREIVPDFSPPQNFRYLSDETQGKIFEALARDRTWNPSS
jgi:predicted transcriptional regulator